MSVVSGSTAVAASSTSANQLTGTDFEYIEGPAIVSIWASTESYVYGTMGFKIGSIDVAEQGTRLNTEQSAGEVNRQIDLVVDKQFIPRGRHLCRLTSKNTNAGATNRFNFLVQIDQP